MMSNEGKRLILLELNEINFDVISEYLASNATRFPALAKIMAGPSVFTSSEAKYEEQEPWIQWVSVHTCKPLSEHGIFRLGDVVGSRTPQIFEILEKEGYKVGAISAMNAENRLTQPAYFIPDPWTQTPTDSSWWSRSLSQAISQAVNDNSQGRVTFRSHLVLILSLLRFGKTRHYRRYFSLAIRSRRKPWLKALFLDLLLHDVHWTMFESKKPNFSVLFLNAGAHIQHHYFFNAEPFRKSSVVKNPSWYVAGKEDPLADVLDMYDTIVQQYFFRTDTEVILATGLSQRPFDRTKFYYRLKNHSDFLRQIGLEFKNVFPRMTRDFLITFDNAEQALAAQRVLGRVQVEESNTPLFGQIDNRGESLFVSLTYPFEIKPSTIFQLNGHKSQLHPHVSFVAIKNGMHQGKGFAFFTPGIISKAPRDGAHVSQLGNSILNYFEVESGVCELAADVTRPTKIGDGGDDLIDASGN